jgi:O-antigen ligase
MPIALYELKTDVHLPMSVQQSESSLYGGEVDRLFASVTFGNLNAYNVVLCMTLSMMLIGTLQKGKRIVWVAYICALMSLLLIILNGSRAASICAALILTLYTFMMMRGKKIFLFAAATAIAGGLLLYFYKDALSLIIQRFQEQGLEDNGRMKVLICGLKEWYGSGGMGVGIDNFNPIMEYKYHLAITPPHNLWLEVGAQYGIFVFIGFFALFIRLFLASRKGTTFNKTAAFIGIAALLPMSIIDSGYLLKTTTWFYIVSLYMVCNPAYNTPTTQEK